jgi:hypothetical protein
MADRDVEIKVKVDAGGASTILDNLGNKIQDLGAKAGISSQGLSSMGQALLQGLGQGVGQAITQTIGRVVDGIIALPGAAINATIELAKLGDAVNDADAGFSVLAEKAGTTSEALRQKLGAAAQGAVDSLTLMQKANKAAAAGLDPAIFDRVVAAAKRYADQTGMEVPAAIDKFTNAVTKQSPRLLQQLDLLKDGKIHLDGYAVALDGSAIAAQSVTDLLDQYKTSIENSDQALGSAIDNSTTMVSITNLLEGAWEKLRTTLNKLLIKLLELADTLTNTVKDAVNGVAIRLLVLTNMMETAASGSMPSYSKGLLAVKAALALSAKEIDGVEVKLKKKTQADKDAAKAAKEHAREVEALAKRFEDLDTYVAKLTGLGGINAAAEQMNNLAAQIKSVITLPADVGGNRIETMLKDIEAEGISLGLTNAQIKESFDKAFGPGTIVEIGKVKDTVSDLDNAIKDIGQSIGNSIGQAITALSSGGDLGATFESLFSSVGSSIGGNLGKALSEELASTLASSLGETLGSAVGSAIPGVGAALGQLGGKLLEKGLESLFGGKSNAGEKARKSADKFFADAFDANRLGIIINGQLAIVKDLVFKGGTLFGGSSSFDGSATFSHFFDTLEPAARQAFAGVGAGFEELLGVSGDISGQIGAVLANNIGGSLNNLQLLVESSGMSFEQLHDGVVAAFMDGKLSALEATSALQGLAQVAQKGIPDGIGKTVEAFEHLEAASKKGGRVSVDALQDIGYEAKELGIKDFPALIKNLEASGKFTSNEIALVFDALKSHGIDSVEKLTSATTEQLIPVLGQLETTKFPFKEAAADMRELITQVNELPAVIEKKVIFNVQVNADSAGKAVLDQVGVKSNTGQGLRT